MRPVTGDQVRESGCAVLPTWPQTDSLFLAAPIFIFHYSPSPVSSSTPHVYTIITCLTFSPPLVQLFTKMWPELLQPPRGEPALRALLCHVHLWDPSTHALLALKHVLAALRMQPPPQSLFPTPAGGGGGVGDEEGGGGTPRGSQGERCRLWGPGGGGGRGG